MWGSYYSSSRRVGVLRLIRCESHPSGTTSSSKIASCRTVSLCACPFKRRFDSIKKSNFFKSQKFIKVSVNFCRRPYSKSLRSHRNLRVITSNAPTCLLKNSKNLNKIISKRYKQHDCNIRLRIRQAIRFHCQG